MTLGFLSRPATLQPLALVTSPRLRLRHGGIVVIPNLLYWDRSKCACSSVSKNNSTNGEKQDADIMNYFVSL